MAKTRLNRADRDVIAEAIIAHKYGPEIAANRLKEYELARKVYDRAYSAKLQKQMAALPDGAFATSDHLMVAVNGQKFQLEVCADTSDDLGVIDQKLDRAKRPLIQVLNKHRGVGYCAEPMLSVLDDDPLGADVVAWRQERDRLMKEPADRRAQLDAALAQFIYFDDLQAQFPEAEAFVVKRWQERPAGGPAGVPAVPIKDLARQLDLPPHTLAA